MTDDGLTPDKLAQAIERLEQEKARRRAAEKPPAREVPTAVERCVVETTANPIISNPPVPAQGKPNRAGPRGPEGLD